MTSVGDIMSPVRVSVSKDDFLSLAIRSMRRGRVSCVLVCDDDKPVGIITERDVVREFASCIDTGKFSDVVVSDVMTREPVCIEHRRNIEEALVLAKSQHIRHLPVIDENEKLVGILTQTDAMKAFLAALNKNTRLQEDFEALKLLSLEDPMLGIGNRRALDVDLKHSEASARRYCKPFAIAMFDVDYFKSYNDRYGHQKGDQALIRIVELIQTNKREIDRLYRYGGEEFLLLMPGTEADSAVQVADRIRRALEQSKLEHTSSPLNILTLSVGVSSSIALWKSVVKKADLALYEAKLRGRNRVEKHQTDNTID